VLGIASRLGGAIRDRRDPSRIDHALPELIKTRIFAIACATRMQTISIGYAMIRC
jgi:hypothetical protein